MITRGIFQRRIVQVSCFLLLIAAIYLCGLLVAKQRLADLRSELQAQVAAQQTLLITIAEITARNGADDVTARIIQDCELKDRTEFDKLLATLNTGLTATELSTLDRLFAACGSFYSERKAVMVLRLEREVEIYEQLVNQLEQIETTSYNKENLILWQSLVEDEKKIRTDFSTLVELQGKIIESLGSGKTVDSPEIVTILAEVTRVQRSLAENSQSASEKRKSLQT